LNHPSKSALSRARLGLGGALIERFELLFRVATPGQLDAGFASLGSFLIQLLVLTTFDALERDHDSVRFTLLGHIRLPFITSGW